MLLPLKSFQFVQGVLPLSSFLQVDDPQAKKLDKNYFDYHKSFATSGVFTNAREVHARMELTEGRYCLVPCTFNPNEEGEFLMRMYTEKNTKWVLLSNLRGSVFHIEKWFEKCSVFFRLTFSPIFSSFVCVLREMPTSQEAEEVCTQFLHAGRGSCSCLQT